MNIKLAVHFRFGNIAYLALVIIPFSNCLFEVWVKFKRVWLSRFPVYPVRVILPGNEYLLGYIFALATTESIPAPVYFGMKFRDKWRLAYLANGWTSFTLPAGMSFAPMPDYFTLIAALKGAMLNSPLLINGWTVKHLATISAWDVVSLVYGKALSGTIRTITGLISGKFFTALLANSSNGASC